MYFLKNKNDFMPAEKRQNDRPAVDLYNCSLLCGHSPRPGPVSVPPGVASSPG